MRCRAVSERNYIHVLLRSSCSSIAHTASASERVNDCELVCTSTKITLITSIARSAVLVTWFSRPSQPLYAARNHTHANLIGILRSRTRWPASIHIASRMRHAQDTASVDHHVIVCESGSHWYHSVTNSADLVLNACWGLRRVTRCQIRHST